MIVGGASNVHVVHRGQRHRSKGVAMQVEELLEGLGFRGLGFRL